MPFVKKSPTFKHLLCGKPAAPKWMLDAFYGTHDLALKAVEAETKVPPNGCPLYPFLNHGKTTFLYRTIAPKWMQ